ncbi:unnamed protein product [Cunninghamella blakesleeana]
MEEHTATKTSYVSPFIDKFKTTQDNANKEFDQFYTYLSKAVTPRRSEYTSNRLLNQSHKIYKPTPKNTSRIRQDLQLNNNKRDNNSTSLTPLLEKQLFMQNNVEIQMMNVDILIVLQEDQIIAIGPIFLLQDQ